MFEFQCGDLIDVRRRQTSAYTVGKRILVSTVSNVKQLRSQIIGARNDVGYDHDDTDTGIVASNNPVDVSSNWMPYSYGNPLVNLGGNILYRVLKTAGIVPEMNDPTQY